MRRRRLGGVAAALLVGLGAAVAAARGGDYYEDNTPEPKGLLSGLFNEKPKNQAKRGKNAKNAKNSKNAPNVAEATPLPTAAVTSTSGSVDSVVAEQQRRMNALIRRMEVCDRLRMIANQTGNEVLMSQADELEERANALYRQQMAGLPLPAQTPLSILADDQPDPNRNRPGTVAAAADRIQSEPRPSGSGGMGGH
jgi:hypothetical protein